MGIQSNLSAKPQIKVVKYVDLVGGIWPQKTVLSLRGKKIVGFLEAVSTIRIPFEIAGACYGAFCTSKGYLVSDFMLINGPSGSLLLVLESSTDIFDFLNRAKIGWDVVVEDQSAEWHFGTLWLPLSAPVLKQRPFRFPPLPPLGYDSYVWTDPRIDFLRLCLLWPKESMRPAVLGTLKTFLQGSALQDTWEVQALLAGVPLMDFGLFPQKTQPLQAGLHRLGGVSLRKGCYPGQEVFTRFWRSPRRRSVLPFICAGELRMEGPTARVLCVRPWQAKKIGWARCSFEDSRNSDDRPLQDLPADLQDQGVFRAFWQRLPFDSTLGRFIESA